ncbi:MAG: hypothetical protein U5J78_01940 [Parasphingorhabdus sp.]|nr:hypothetical protein [Parasphingorhabdus sp.]
MTQAMIHNLVDELTPVKVMRGRNGMIAVLTVAAIAAVTIAAATGLRADLLSGDPHRSSARRHSAAARY